MVLNNEPLNLSPWYPWYLNQKLCTFLAYNVIMLLFVLIPLVHMIKAVHGVMEETLIITGGIPLRGEVYISGAKNAAVAIIPAALLINGKCTIENVPHIGDVDILLDIIRQ